MITLTAKINLLSGDNKALSLGSDNLSGNNISSYLSKVVGGKTKGSNPFIIGASKLGDGSTLSGKVDYFIGNQLSDNNGKFLPPYNIKIESKKSGVIFKNLTIEFDTINNRHPRIVKFLKEIETTSEKEVTVKKEIVEYISPEIISIENNNDNGDIIVSFSVSLSLKDIVGSLKNGKIIFCEIMFTYTSYEKDGVIGEESGNYKHENEEITISSNRLNATIKYSINIGEGENANILNASCRVKVGYSYTDTVQTSSKDTIELGEYIDDDPIFTLNLPNPYENVELTDFIIRISDWNTPKYPLVITGIYSQVDIEIDYRNLISISRSIFDRSDLKLPSFGIISNMGNIEFNDTNGEIQDYAEHLLLQSGLSCEIKLNNTLVDGASETIGVFETDQWNYENDSRVVSVSIKDDLEEWQDINVPEISYDPRKVESKPFSWLYEHLWELTSNRNSYVNANGETITAKGNYNMFSLVELDEDTQAVLNNTYIQYPLLESGSLWQQWTKLCQACQLHIYKNNDGVIVCRYNGGN